jgi:hypothetical protein
MDDMLHIKLVVNNAIVDMQADPRPELKLPLSNLFIKPLANFGPGYDVFIASIGSDAAAYDRWLNLQMKLVTDFGPNREKLMEEFMQVFKDVISQTPGGEAHTTHDDVNSISFQLALMLRVYGDSISLETPPAPAGKQK